jgi:XRE family transcriptional regulator, regulator of sulfur utilization
MSLGEKIIRLRKSKGISQELLAENSHISLRTIQRIESGASFPRPYTVKAIADALEIPVDQLSSLESTQPQSTDEALAVLRLINLSALVVFILPVGNIIVPLLIWRKNKDLPLVNITGRKIISFQILWTLVTFLVAISAHAILLSTTRSVSIGRLPPTIFLVYFTLLTINFILIVRSAIQLGKEKTEIYSFVPTLF